MAKAFLIDGTACCYRAFYAIRALSTSSGRPTNAVFGVVKIVEALRGKEHPDYLAVAFDVGKPTFRHRKFEQYKIQRKPMPDPLIAQIPVVKTVLSAYRIPMFESEGYEAEDVLATMARQIAGNGVEVFLVTGDKDALQLVNSHVKVYNPQKEGLILDAAAVKARYGVEPAQVVDLMALMGDAIDNIPGVPGIGEKTASQLIQRFGSVDALYKCLDELQSSAQRSSLETAKDQVRLSRELAQIDAHVPVTVRLEDLRPQEPDWRALRTLFRELEFKQLLADLEVKAPAPERSAVTVRLLKSAHDLDVCVAELRQSRVSVIACWPRAQSLADASFDASRNVLIAIATRSDSAWVGWLQPELLARAAGRVFVEWLADPSAGKIAHDAKRVKRLLEHVGLIVEGVAGDPMLVSYLLNPARTNQTLHDLADEQLDERLPILPPIEVVQTAIDEHGLEPFAAAACATLRLHAHLAPQLQEKGLAALYTELELPLISVLARMEATGIAIDLPYIATLRASMETTLARLADEITRLAGCDFNMNSPKQLAQVLFERLKLPVIKRTKTGPSTDSGVLQQLAEHHPLPKQLMQYRELAKLVSTYLEALPKLVDARTGRLHSSFNQTVTSTGRLSSSEPNLQNIPIKTELGRSIRKAFIPGIPDGLLLAADYSQIELRILAHLSGDEHLIDAFRQDRDIHRFTASLIYGVPESEVQREQRNAMKAINYGILYGMTSHGLSKELNVSFEEAQAFIDAYFERYPGVQRYYERQLIQAKRDGFVQTLLGRRRYIPELNSSDPMIRQFGERMALNAPIQGTAADLIKRAMIQLDDELERSKRIGRMLLQVHDELVFETPRRFLLELAALVRKMMEGAIALDVPLTVTLKAGPNWLDLKSV